MAATKDNFFIESDVAAIKREKDMRRENMCRDVSLLGVAVCFIGGYGQSYFQDSKKNQDKVKEA